MDKFFFEDSSLSETVQSEWRARFDDIASKVPNEGFTLTLHFRDMLGLPNAMALPSGDIIVTDAFIDLVEDPFEFDAVMLHEIGHVVERHGLTQVIQGSALTVIVGTALGDASGLGELAIGLPVAMMQSSYSRDAESSADEYSFAQGRELGIDPKHFAAIILRLCPATLAGKREHFEP